MRLQSSAKQDKVRQIYTCFVFDFQIAVSTSSQYRNKSDFGNTLLSFMAIIGHRLSGEVT